MKRLWMTILLTLGLTVPSTADVVLPAVFGDHMVLQQNAYVPIWGRAEPGEHITFEASWEDMTLSIFTDSRGRWRIDIPTPKAGGPYRLSIQGKNEIVLKDVWLGEVWLASGQSNMEWPLSRSENGQAAIEGATDSLIRFFQVEHDVASSARFDCRGRWQVSDPSNVGGVSAVAYHYAAKLRQELEVPIGIVQSTWGGTTAEAWMSRASLESKADFKPLLNRFDEALRLYRQDETNPDPIQKRQPTTLYNAMIAPLIPFEIRGVIWYQGEANRYDPYLYRELFPTLIESWRREWQRNLPFFYVQLAPFGYAAPLVGAGVREAQRRTLARLPKTGMAVTLDVGNPDDIHPRQKQVVGERLALWALNQTYGQTEVVCSGPLYKRMETRGDSIQLHFDYAQGGLKVGENGALQGFEIAGFDYQFQPAKASVSGEKLWVWHDSIMKPQAVRYAFRNTSEASLFNQAGLPASSFRTDDWPVFYGQPQVELKYLPTEKNYEVSLAYAVEALETQILYTVDGSVPDRRSPAYQKPFKLSPPATLQLRLYAERTLSPQVFEWRLSKHYGMEGEIIRQTEAHPRYTGGGKQALLDGITGEVSNRAKYWQGFQEEDFELVVDLGQKKNLSLLKTQFLARNHEGIFLPLEVEIAFSNNDRNYRALPKQVPEQSTGLEPPSKQNIIFDVTGTRARYVRLRVKSMGKCPDWHPRAGQPAWLFMDELVIR
jgi:sialate O-acetylesterase